MFAVYRSVVRNVSQRLHTFSPYDLKRLWPLGVPVCAKRQF
jgi:hypothetical protein